ncbi:uncharacterized protein LAESUDRAFT_743562 [Laetiporus sulphureus 93-53]|uniref:MYND-type domain-containing protein n=1 Tax=Laetiporus sulphureus 93-53 TaxID=1314785 RepID=A0A165E266_9APHY|nr:uncharacterized protein LAESUDRAFT_743562 [Laetiporus sulphureus 93-53]KZT06101.1 hypothetical protein LAESUDRAFT_743562 [Laetiporus sulphureus 93-53]
MRESNFAFPVQNRACVCISSQLYDRRALDTNSPLPLFNSLTHLTYLTSTSPRIREIMTMDGGLERLVRILHDFCMCPPPPENPTLFYGLSPSSAHPPKLVPTLNPKSFDKQAQYRFTLAFQCVVNIGVRGSEPIRSRVVQAGTLDVVGCILEAWLAGHGFAVGPSVSASGLPRETREQRNARRLAQQEARQKEQADALARALQRQVNNAERASGIERGPSSSNREDNAMETESPTSRQETDISTGTSTETSNNVTPGGTDTPTGAVIVPGRDRSGTIIARPTWDQAAAPTNAHRRGHRTRHHQASESAAASTSTSADNSRPETETEDDGDVDMDRESSREVDEHSISGTPPPERRASIASVGTVRGTAVHARRAVGIVSDAATNTTGASLEINSDAHIIINEQNGVGVDGVSVEDGLVSLEANDDFAMGAPPGAPGAIDGPAARAVSDVHGPGERTPRAGTANLPHAVPIALPPVPNTTTVRVTAPTETGTMRGRTSRAVNATPTAANMAGSAAASSHGHHHMRETDTGPYRDEDVLLSLQLLAYLSKYPHVRQAFYKPRPSFHPATAQLPVGDGRFAQPVAGPSTSKASITSSTPTKEPNSFRKVFNTATGRGKEKEKAPAVPEPNANGSAVPPNTPTRMTNVFSLVERFTFRHSSADLDSPNPPPSLPPEIQYWAGVIMRNACRKDETRGGIRQCANMLCGRWESYPREFAKCRRCRKAKYCGKECQSTAWSEGHRFWCSAKDPEEDGEHHHSHHGESSRSAAAGSSMAAAAGAPGIFGITRRNERERERDRLVRAMVTDVRLADQIGVARPPAHAIRPAVSNISISPNDTLATLNAVPSPVVAVVGPSAGETRGTALEAERGEDMVIG